MRFTRRNLWIPLLAGIVLTVLFYIWGALFNQQLTPNPYPTLKARLHKTITGHSKEVWQVAFSPDGQYLASGSYDQTVKVWRLRDGVLERTLTGHAGTVWSVAFSPDGQRLASSGEDKTVKLWRLESLPPSQPE